MSLSIEHFNHPQNIEKNFAVNSRQGKLNGRRFRSLSDSSLPIHFSFEPARKAKKSFLKIENEKLIVDKYYLTKNDKFWSAFAKIKNENWNEMLIEGNTIDRETISSFYYAPFLIPVNKFIKLDLFLKENSIDLHDLSSLTLAVIIQDRNQIYKALLTTSVDQPDGKGITALQYAMAEKVRTSIIKLLLDSGADPMVKNAHNSPINIAINNGDLEIFNLLMNAKDEISQFTNLGYNIYSIAKFQRSHNYKIISQIILENYPEVISHHKYLTLAKLLGHSNEFEVISSYQNENFHVDFSTCGMLGSYFAKQFLKSLNLFFKKFTPFSSTTKSTIEFALQRLADEKIYTSKQLAEYCLQGNPLFIKSGFIEHINTFLIWNGKLVICDRIECHKKSVEIYSLKKISPTLIQKIRSLATLDAKSADEKLQTIIDDYCSKKDSNDLTLEHLLSLPPQNVGNCSWANVEQAVFALMVLEEIKEVQSNSDTPLNFMDEIRIADMQKTIFKNFMAFQQIRYLKKYLNFVKNNPNLYEKHIVKLSIENIKTNDNMYPEMQAKFKKVLKQNSAFRKKSLRSTLSKRLGSLSKRVLPQLPASR